MEEVFLRALHNIERKNKGWYITAVVGIVTLFVVVILGTAFLVYWACRAHLTLGEIFRNDIVTNIIASFVGVAALFLTAHGVLLLLQIKEDEHKVSFRNRDMWRQYGKNYRNIFDLNGSKFLVYCETLLQMKEGKETRIYVEDRPQKFFELDPFIKMHCATLLEAHAKSKTVDSVTVRLADFEPATPENGNVATIHTMRSSYLAHLLTNRALDYLIEGKLSVRKLFENDETLRPLHRAMLSNHFGVNALVFLKRKTDKKDKDGNIIYDPQGWLLLPHRNRKATVAKNSLTASIATRLEMKSFPKKYDDIMTPDYIRKGCINDSIEKAIRVPKKYIDETKTDIKFLGLCRDIYEGGKPTLFYAVYMDMTPQQYEAYHAEWEQEEQKQKAKEANKSRYRLLEKENVIDEIKTIYIVDWQSVKMESIIPCGAKEPVLPEKEIHDRRLDDAKLEFNVLIGFQGDTPVFKRNAVGFEQNLISNFMFLDEFTKPEETQA